MNKIRFRSSPAGKIRALILSSNKKECRILGLGWGDFGPLQPIQTIEENMCHAHNNKFSVHEPLHKFSVHEPLHKFSVHEPLHKFSVHEPLHKFSVHEPLHKFSVHEPLHKFYFMFYTWIFVFNEKFFNITDKCKPLMWCKIFVRERERGRGRGRGREICTYRK